MVAVLSEFGVYWAVGGRLFHLTGHNRMEKLTGDEQRKTWQDAGNVILSQDPH